MMSTEYDRHCSTTSVASRNYDSNVWKCPLKFYKKYGLNIPNGEFTNTATNQPSELRGNEETETPEALLHNDSQQLESARKDVDSSKKSFDSLNSAYPEQKLSSCAIQVEFLPVEEALVTPDENDYLEIENAVNDRKEKLATLFKDDFLKEFLLEVNERTPRAMLYNNSTHLEKTRKNIDSSKKSFDSLNSGFDAQYTIQSGKLYNSSFPCDWGHPKDPITKTCYANLPCIRVNEKPETNWPSVSKQELCSKKTFDKNNYTFPELKMHNCAIQPNSIQGNPRSSLEKGPNTPNISLELRHAGFVHLFTIINKSMNKVDDKRAFTPHFESNVCEGERIGHNIASKRLVLIILRGLPGSGKSTLATQLQGPGAVFSTDDYFLTRGGYCFDLDNLQQAHAHTKMKTMKALGTGVSPVIVDNTNTRAWEMEPYVRMGVQHKYIVEVLEPNSKWKFDTKILAHKNIHGVSKEKLSEMFSRYQMSDSVCDELKSKVKSALIFRSGSPQQLANEVSPSDKFSNNLALANNQFSSSQFSGNKLSSSSKVSTKIPFGLESLCANPYQHKRSSFSLDDMKMAGKLCQHEENKCTSSNALSSEHLQSLRREKDLKDFGHDISLNSITERDDDFSCNYISAENASYTFPRNSPDLSLKSRLTNPSLKLDLKSPNEAKEFQDLSYKQIIAENLDSSDALQLPLAGSDPPVTITSSESVDININENSEQPNFDLGTKSRRPCGWTSEDGTSESSSSQESNENISASDTCMHESSEIPKPQRKNGSTFPIFDKEVCQSADSKVTMQTAENELEKWSDSTQPHNSEIQETKVHECLKPKSRRKVWETLQASVPSTLDNNGRDINEIHLTDDYISKVMISNFRKAFSRKPLLPETDNYMGKDWTFPAYDSLQKDTSICESIPEINASSMSHADTQTEIDDSILSYKVDMNFAYESDCRVITSGKNKFWSEVATCSREQFHCLASIAKFEKSTSTEDVIPDIETSEKLKHLMEVFPNISCNDMNHFLDICAGDTVWLSNILADSECNYNNPNAKLPSTGNYLSRNSNACPNNPFALASKLLPTSSSKSDPVEPCKTEVKCGSFNEKLPKPLPETTSSYDTKPFETLVLTLDLGLALQLEELFGSADPDGLSSPNKRSVEIDFGTAKLLHSKWKKLAPMKSNKITGNESKGSSHSIQLLKGKREMPPQVKTDPSEPMPLSQIMDLEYALVLHKNEKLKKDEDISTRIKRLELYERFPGADPMSLDRIFDDNNYSLEATLGALDYDLDQYKKEQKNQNTSNWVEYGTIGCERQKWRKENLKRASAEDGINKGNVTANAALGPNHYLRWVSPDAPPVPTPTRTSSIPLEAQELRESASKHYVRQREQSRKASAAYQRGEGAAAAFYANEASKANELFEIDKQKAAAVILEAKNRFVSPYAIDLHGLVVKEAILALDKFLRSHKSQLLQNPLPGTLTVTIITGQGSHSEVGPKLKPSVMEFLKKAKYNFGNKGRGSLEVYFYPEIGK